MVLAIAATGEWRSDSPVPLSLSESAHTNTQTLVKNSPGLTLLELRPVSSERTPSRALRDHQLDIERILS